MPKPGIPAVPIGPADIYRFLSTLKENIELLTGVRGGTLNNLTDDATLADVIDKLNEVIDRINAR